MIMPSEIAGALSPVADAGFSPWESLELAYMFFDQSPDQLLDRDDRQGQGPVTPVNYSNNNSTGSDESNRTCTVADERKKRRMISNRESARRSRLRKQMQLEDLRNESNRLKIHNREIATHLEFVSHHCRLVRRENERLRSESSFLRRKLSDIRRTLLLRQLQLQFSSPLINC